MVKTLIICLLNRNSFFAAFEKVRPGAKQNSGIYFKNPSKNY